MRPIINLYANHIKQLYQERIQKITVLYSSTCPNRDGKVGVGGCSYCNNEAFAPPEHLRNLSLIEQIEHGIKISKRRYKAKKYIVYFQAYTNTYAPFEQLKASYLEALSHPEVCGLSIGTRPDTISDQIIEFLAELNQHSIINIELGLESISNDTLKRINRGHDVECFVDAVKRIEKFRIPVCAHLILGFPWEDKQIFSQSAKFISQLPINYLKLHQLHLVKGTKLAQEFECSPFKILSKEEYINAVATFLDHLRPEIVLQRVCGEAPKHLLLPENWTSDHSKFTQELLRHMEKNGLFQGRLHST